MEEEEASPLLGRMRLSFQRTSAPLVDDATEAPTGAKEKKTFLLVLSAILFITSWSNGLAIIPLMRLIEDRLCHEYYREIISPMDPIDEGFCKQDPIQSKLAFITSVNVSIEAVICFIAAFPWGAAADRFGRKPIYSIAITGISLGYLIQMNVLWFRDIFPITFIWISGAASLFGGGNAVLSGLIFSMATDATDQENRAVIFLRLQVVSILGALMSPILASAVMEKASPWASVWIGISLLWIGAVSIHALPELSNSSDKRKPTEDDKATANNTGLVKDSMPIPGSLMILLVIVLLATPVSFCTLQFMSQYTSRRYHVNLSQTAYLQSFFGITTILQAFLILPWVSRALARDTTPRWLRVKDERVRDLAITRWSFGFLLVGLVVLGAAPGLNTFIVGLLLVALGSPFNSLMKSLMSLYCDPQHRSRLFSIISMVETLGKVYSDPMLAGLFASGMHLGSFCIGLPYFVVGGLVLICILLLSRVKLPQLSGFGLDVV